MNQPPTLSARMETFREVTVQNQRSGCDHFAAARLAAEMIGHVRGPGLDLGTRHAVMASTLAAIHGITVVSVDVDAIGRDVAELVAFEFGVRREVRFLVGDPICLPFPDQYFGCAAMMDWICEIPQPVAVLRELARVLEPGAPLILGDLTPTGLKLEANAPRADLHAERRCSDFLGSLALAAEQGLEVVMRAEGFLHDLAVLRKGGASKQGVHRRQRRKQV